VKLVTFEVATPLGPVERLGALHRGRVLDLNAAFGARLREQGDAQPARVADCLLPPDLLAFLEMGDRGMSSAREAIALVEAAATRLEPELWRGPRGETVVYEPAEVQLKAPLPRPPSLRDFLAFEAHARAGFARRGEAVPEAWYEMPVYYKGNPRSIVGPDEDVWWPRYTERLDYELELACVIGRRGRNVSLEAAADYIAGYTVMNDWSARDIQRAEMQVRLGPAKGKDFATSLGPCLVTPDELDPRNLRMVARVNGEVWSDGNSGTSRWTFPQMIVHVSQDETIYPGDVFGSGTVGGGCGLELDRWIQPGDVVELEIEGIGVLRNRVVKP
jgi:2-keto-4-pentenoate hydratase/2-oxohepta-3-ene-1,7-dioic acid hydratase in catechol pathway